jgi:hypothetical protein
MPNNTTPLATEKKLRNRHRLNTFLNGLYLIAKTTNIRGSISTTVKNVFNRSLTVEELTDLQQYNVLHKPEVKNKAMLYQLEKLKVKIKF